MTPRCSSALEVMKPNSKAVVTLRGFDDYVDYTDTRVGPLGLPA